MDEDAGYIKCSSDKICGAEIDLDFPSVGATENIMMAAVLAERRDSYIKCSYGTRDRRFRELFK